jgi:exosortase/archaeosortase family protein
MNPPQKAPSTKAGAVLSLGAFLPVLLETLLVRRWAHWNFGSDILRLGVHASDVYVPMTLGFCVFFVLAQIKDPLPIGPRWTTLKGNLSFLVGCLLLSLWLEPMRATLGPDLTSLIFLLCAIGTFLTSFFVLVPFRRVSERVRQQPSRVLYVLLAAQLLVAYPLVLERAWKPMAMWTGQGSYHLLNAVGIWVQKPQLYNSLRLWNPSFSAYMNMGCSGLEGIFFFLSGFVLVNAYEGRPLNLLRTALLCVSGCALMFALNVFRISAFFAGSVLMERHYPDEAGRAFFEWAFHANAGWVFYLAGMWWFFNRWVIQPEGRTS